MKCNEVQTMQDPYLDSELDARTTLEIEQHLAGCSTCTRLFAQEQRLEARIMAGLNRGSRTASLWTQIEREVTAASSASHLRPTAHDSPMGRSRRRQSARSLRSGVSADYRRRLLEYGAHVLGALAAQLQAGWRRSRWAWTGLAAAWAVILVLHLAAREPDVPLVAGQEVPSASEMRLALEQKHLLMAELALTSYPAPADKPKPARPTPHSERRNETLNA